MKRKPIELKHNKMPLVSPANRLRARIQKYENKIRELKESIGRPVMQFSEGERRAWMNVISAEGGHPEDMAEASQDMLNARPRPGEIRQGMRAAHHGHIQKLKALDWKLKRLKNELTALKQ